jgi:hypothetical protein
MEVIKNFLLQTDFSTPRIASLADVPLSFVEQVKKNLNTN